jgi:hypothetical protein
VPQDVERLRGPDAVDARCGGERGAVIAAELRENFADDFGNDQSSD